MRLTLPGILASHVLANDLIALREMFQQQMIAFAATTTQVYDLKARVAELEREVNGGTND